MAEPEAEVERRVSFAERAAASANAGAEDGQGANEAQGADSQSVIAEALKKVKGGYLEGELREVPESYGSGPNRAGRRFLPEDHNELPEKPHPQRHVNNPQPTGTIWSDDYNGRRAMTVGDVQKELPKPEKLKDLVRYKGPMKEKNVLKQATVNAELEKAIDNGDSDKVAALLRFGFQKRCVNVNAPLWPKRDRMLHKAARINARDICVMLLEARAEIDCEEISDGRHPIHDACLSGSYDVVELLLDRKALIEENTFRGLRPLHWAATAGRADVIDLLLDRQAKINAFTSEMHQPLHYAAKEGHAEAVRLLCQRGAKLDVEANGRRPIHLACMSGHLKAAAALMDHGCLGLLEEFNPTGLLKMQQESPLEDMMRTVEQLRFQRDEAEEFSDMGQDEDAEELFKKVIESFMSFGMVNSAKAAHADATRCGITLEPIS